MLIIGLVTAAVLGYKAKQRGLDKRLKEMGDCLRSYGRCI